MIYQILKMQIFCENENNLFVSDKSLTLVQKQKKSISEKNFKKHFYVRKLCN